MARKRYTHKGLESVAREAQERTVRLHNARVEREEREFIAALEVGREAWEQILAGMVLEVEEMLAVSAKREAGQS